jgi:hypothetical protein
MGGLGKGVIDIEEHDGLPAGGGVTVQLPEGTTQSMFWVGQLFCQVSVAEGRVATGQGATRLPKQRLEVGEQRPASLNTQTFKTG